MLCQAVRVSAQGVTSSLGFFLHNKLYQQRYIDSSKSPYKQQLMDTIVNPQASANGALVGTLGDERQGHIRTRSLQGLPFRKAIRTQTLRFVVAKGGGKDGLDLMSL